MQIKDKIVKNRYKNCIEISNESTRVVLKPDCGGRILDYPGRKAADPSKLKTTIHKIN